MAKALHKGGTADFGKGNTVGYAAKEKSGHLAPWAFDRRNVGEEDICIQIAYSGICHSDVHQIRNEWGNTQFPCNPGCAHQAHPCVTSQPSTTLCPQVYRQQCQGSARPHALYGMMAAGLILHGLRHPSVCRGQFCRGADVACHAGTRLWAL